MTADARPGAPAAPTHEGAARAAPAAPARTRKIIHVDMDAFYASVEQRDDPSLRGVPVVVAWKGARSVVCAASYEARPFGIHSAMPALRAERLCPHAVFVAPDFARYKEVTRQIHAVFSRYTDRIEPLSLDEAYLDVTEPLRDLGSATAIATEIRAAIRDETGLTASAGIAPNKFLAKIASDWNKPDGQFVLRPSMLDAFLPVLPVGRLPGVGKVTQARLEALGLRTCADLRALGEARLVEAFGRWGRRLHQLASGIDERPVQARQASITISSEDTFATDLPLDGLAPHLERLAQSTWARYGREWQRNPGRAARTVVLKLKTADFRILTRSLTSPAPPVSAAELAHIAIGLCGRVGLPESMRYRLAGVGLSGFVQLDPADGFAQDDLFPAS